MCFLLVDASVPRYFQKVLLGQAQWSQAAVATDTRSLCHEGQVQNCELYIDLIFSPSKDLLSLNIIIVNVPIFQATKEIQVSLFQALVLLLFNEADSFTLEEILENTKIGSPRDKILQAFELKRTFLFFFERRFGIEADASVSCLWKG